MARYHDDWKAMSGQQRKAFTLELTQIYGWNCALCKLPIQSEADLTCEHLKARSQGGVTTRENCRPAHSWCNYSKGAGIYAASIIEHDGLALFWP